MKSRILSEFTKLKSLVVTGVMAFITGITMSLAFRFSWTPLEIAPIATLFVSSVSGVIFQIRISLHIRRDIRTGETKNIELLTSMCTAEMAVRLQKLLEIDQDKQKNIIIICYGTDGYSEIVPTIAKGKFGQKIKVELVYLDPDSAECPDSDKDHIKKTIENIKSKAKESKVSVALFPTKCPPTIRASVLYDENNSPIWASLQSYYFDSFPHYVTYSDSVIIVGKKENDEDSLNKLADSIAAAFKRFKKNKINKKSNRLKNHDEK